MRKLSGNSVGPLLAIVSLTSVACSGGSLAGSNTAPDAGDDGASNSAYVPAAYEWPDALPSAPDLEGDAVVTAPEASTCVPSTTPDVPDDNFQDTNCDGIDGDKAHAIFVAPSGSDTADGSFGSPVQTFAAAVPLAIAQNKDIYACNATYAESVQLTGSGVNVYGGYDCANGWQRIDDVLILAPPAVAAGLSSAGSTDAGVPMAGDAGSPSSAPPATLTISGVTQAVTIDHAKIVSANALSAGGSSIAALVTSSPNVTLHHVLLQAGAGADGSSGASVQAMTMPAPNGAPGQDGTGAWTCGGLPWSPPSQAPVAPAATNTPLHAAMLATPEPTATTGLFPITLPVISIPVPAPPPTNAGGIGVFTPASPIPAGCYLADFAAQGGSNTAVSACGSPGGVGGSKTSGAQAGQPSGLGGACGTEGSTVTVALPGSAGATGVAGSGPSVDPTTSLFVGTFSAQGYVPTNAGTDGTSGGPGGGGGGGAFTPLPSCAQGMYNASVYSPGGGGQGGFGGCGGAGGYGGGGGGASIGLLVVGSLVTFSTGQVSTSPGGQGGSPSAGASGQAGGQGGSGGMDVLGGGLCGPVAQASSAQAGAPGGPGGSGGSGGPGGGGPSLGIVNTNATTATDAVVFNIAAGGKGGACPSAACPNGDGPDGISQNVLTTGSAAAVGDQ